MTQQAVDSLGNSGPSICEVIRKSASKLGEGNTWQVCGQDQIQEHKAEEVQVLSAFVFAQHTHIPGLRLLHTRQKQKAASSKQHQLPALCVWDVPESGALPEPKGEATNKRLLLFAQNSMLSSTARSCLASGIRARHASMPRRTLFMDIVNQTQVTLEAVHTASGVPWWGVMVGTALTVRACLIPVSVFTMREVTKLGVRWNEVLTAYHQVNVQANRTSSIRRVTTFMKIFNSIRKEHNIGLWGTIASPAVHIPVLVTLSFAIRSIATNNPGFAEAGPLFLSNLAEIDATHILPVIHTGVILLNCEFGFPSVGAFAYIKRAAQLSALFFLPVLLKLMPSGVLLYWFMSACWTTAQMFAFRQPQIRNIILGDILPPSFTQAPHTQRTQDTQQLQQQQQQQLQQQTMQQETSTQDSTITAAPITPNSTQAAPQQQDASQKIGKMVHENLREQAQDTMNHARAVLQRFANLPPTPQLADEMTAVLRQEYDAGRIGIDMRVLLVGSKIKSFLAKGKIHIICLARQN
eukprot:c11519_g2_i3.p1 GENE.c11519_g2_i3~~c11519_g2_i3.p1  ORF type:complete len:522 (-),score=133.72 c11519_g2_i3:16-1581(-)